MQLDTGNPDLTVPDIKLQMFPKDAYTAGKQSRLKILCPRDYDLRIMTFPGVSGIVNDTYFHLRLDGSLQGGHPALHGLGALAIHHVSPDLDSRREGEEDQGRDEDHGPKRFCVLVRRRGIFCEPAESQICSNWVYLIQLIRFDFDDR